MHDNDIPCCSAEQTAWLNVVDALRRHIIKNTNKKPGLDVKILSELVDISSQVMQLHVWANSFDEMCLAKKAREKRKIEISERHYE